MKILDQFTMKIYIFWQAGASEILRKPIREL